MDILFHINDIAGRDRCNHNGCAGNKIRDLISGIINNVGDVEVFKRRDITGRVAFTGGYEGAIMYKPKTTPSETGSTDFNLVKDTEIIIPIARKISWMKNRVRLIIKNTLPL